MSRIAIHPRLIITITVGLLISLSMRTVLAAPSHSRHLQAAQTRFIHPFAVLYGGAKLTAADVPTLAKFELLDIARYRYNQVNGDTWAAIKQASPGAKIFIYELGPSIANFQDKAPAASLNNISRYAVARDSLGTFNGDHPDLFLLDTYGKRTYDMAFSKPPSQYYYLMDFGSPGYQSLWSRAVVNDILDQPWKADGIFVDNCTTLDFPGGFGSKDPNGKVIMPAQYPDKQSWAAAMNRFAQGISTELAPYQQSIWCNRGATNDAMGAKAWLELDNAASHPELVMEEGAFVVSWGGSTRFYSEAEWKRQVDTMVALKNTSATYLSHTKLVPSGPRSRGTDNYGRPVTFNQTLWFALGSYLLGKEDTASPSYFAFVSMDPAFGYNTYQWFDEYENIDLGRALNHYQVMRLGGTNLYWRPFEYGYVLVNPTPHVITNITQFGKAHIMTHATLGYPLSRLPVRTRFYMPPHTALIVRTGR